MKIIKIFRSIAFYLILFQIIFIILLGIFGEFYSSFANENSNLGDLYPSTFFTPLLQLLIKKKCSWMFIV